MGTYTSPKTTSNIYLTTDYKTILSNIPVLGDNGEPIGLKFYANIRGFLAPLVVWPFGVAMDVRFLRNSKLEGQTGFDETGLESYNPNPRYRDKATGKPYWKQYVAQPWGFDKNCTNVAVQVRCYNAEGAYIQPGAFLGSTDYD